MIYAIVDIGSNTIRMNTYQLIGSDGYELLFTKKYMAGLASYVEDECLSYRGIRKLEEVLTDVRETLEHVNVDELHIFATASLRKVKNRNGVVDYIKDRVGLDIEIIDGKREAYLGFIGIRQFWNEQSGVCIDIGGGSTEIVFFDGEKITDILNLDDGSLSLFNEYVQGVLPTQEEWEKIRTHLKKSFAELKCPRKTDVLIGIGGTLRICGKMIAHFQKEEPRNHATTEEIDNFLDKLHQGKRAAIHTILSIKPERIHTTIPGLMILSEACRFLGVKEVRAVNTGIREGYLTDKMKENGYEV